MPMPAHMTLEGEKQGKIDGSCDMKGRENTILVEEFRHKVHIPHDPQTGLGTGKRVHGEFTVVKMYDKSSPKLYQALCSGEHMKNVEVKWYRIKPDGTEEHYFTHKLTDAIVVEVRPYMPNCLDPNLSHFQHMEEVALTYRKIEWTFEPGGIMADDDWTVPR
jgi:type VI secretion system secreted protein Hcp